MTITPSRPLSAIDHTANDALQSIASASWSILRTGSAQIYEAVARRFTPSNEVDATIVAPKLTDAPMNAQQEASIMEPQESDKQSSEADAYRIAEGTSPTNIIRSLFNETLPIREPSDPHCCEHKEKTMCALTMPLCCACADKRPDKLQSKVYIDGIGFTQSLQSRWHDYCPRCKGKFHCDTCVIQGS